MEDTNLPWSHSGRRHLRSEQAETLHREIRDTTTDTKKETLGVTVGIADVELLETTESVTKGIGSAAIGSVEDLGVVLEKENDIIAAIEIEIVIGIAVGELKSNVRDEIDDLEVDHRAVPDVAPEAEPPEDRESTKKRKRRSETKSILNRKKKTLIEIPLFVKVTG